MALTDDKKLDVLHDHYKDSFTQIKEHLKLRDRLFILILLLVTVMLFQVFSPNSAQTTISKVVNARLGLKDTAPLIDFTFVSSVIWFALLAAVVRYYQVIIFIDRQYIYMDKLEDQLSASYCDPAFTREGRFYLNEYPFFSECAHVFYRVLFPLILLAVTAAKIWMEWPAWTTPWLTFGRTIVTSPSVLADSAIFLVLAAIATFFFGKGLWAFLKSLGGWLRSLFKNKSNSTAGGTPETAAIPTDEGTQHEE